MIIDTHFHAFPQKYLELLPEAKNDLRGTGLHAFDHNEYLDVMDKYGIDIGVLSNTAGRVEKLAAVRGPRSFARWLTTNSPTPKLNILSVFVHSPDCRCLMSAMRSPNWSAATRNYEWTA